MYVHWRRKNVIWPSVKFIQFSINVQCQTWLKAPKHAICDLLEHDRNIGHKGPQEIGSFTNQLWQINRFGKDDLTEMIGPLCLFQYFCEIYRIILPILMGPIYADVGKIFQPVLSNSIRVEAFHVFVISQYWCIRCNWGTWYWYQNLIYVHFELNVYAVKTKTCEYQLYMCASIEENSIKLWNKTANSLKIGSPHKNYTLKNYKISILALLDGCNWKQSWIHRNKYVNCWWSQSVRENKNERARFVKTNWNHLAHEYALGLGISGIFTLETRNIFSGRVPDTRFVNAIQNARVYMTRKNDF